MGNIYRISPLALRKPEGDLRRSVSVKEFVKNGCVAAVLPLPVPRFLANPLPSYRLALVGRFIYATARHQV